MVKHTIVSLDTLLPSPPVSFDHELIEYPHTTPEQLPERIQNATIVLTSITPVTKEAIENARKLELIACNRTGTDHIALPTAAAHNIAITHVPAQSAASVAEHAFAMYFALRRQILPFHGLTLEGQTWKEDNMLHQRFERPPRTNDEETLVVVGYGAIGKEVERLGRALGMGVRVAERKGARAVRQGRVAFEEGLVLGTVFLVVVPSSVDGGTRDMFTGREFEVMDSSAVVVNCGRGGAINESDLAAALKNKQIGGAATDVYEHEPATRENCPLLDPTIPNLVLSPHIAWFSSKTIKNTVAVAKANLEAFAAGNPQNMVQ
ncbi:hypothetical protein M409DRAFT_67285 [Zasmidium cellare ATCC 36951]|uniref:D-isomer specific 2-hydroxyacid dehydrogenase NAD-binding domain-containing protein n=1 Tax=Zasmidium cellare ATCC 36951 TaxID=1080233 RepID=A0A6A6CGZ6_ZASCE|nr:uncharacterized protein M409DRAFT_67285 [Zasmidium cellare ATCC 36951]KAF2165460.1 hypothetical protein M409DRAFT_67285 [Zasmidium cellare ATCC 36951]